jgi:hypothetical protein
VNKKTISLNAALLVIAAALAVTAPAGCSKICGPSGNTPGALDKNDAARILKEYRKLYGAGIIMTGHAAGSYQEYPVEAGKRLKAKKPAAELMIKALSEGTGLDAVEVDVQSDDRGTVFILHNRIKKKHGEEAGLTKEHRLDGFLGAFAKNFKNKNKSVFIEIKCRQAEELETAEFDLVLRTLETVNGMIRAGSMSAADAEKSISFISFNLMALETLRALSSSKEFGNIKYRLYFIAGSNSMIGRIGTSVCPQINFLNDDAVKRIAHSKWLTGIWFDPSWVDDYGKIFILMNEERKIAGLPELEYFISTYKSDEAKKPSAYKEKFDREAPGFRNIRGLIFDVNK